MELNMYWLFVSALIPLILGFIWYHPKAFGTLWMNHCGVSKERLESGNMLFTFGLTYIFSLLISFFLFQTLIHQFGAFQLFMSSPEYLKGSGAEVEYFNDFMARFGDRHRTFNHGLLHGGLAAVTFVLPIIGIIGLFERKSWKYIMVNFGFWFVSLALMGGLLCPLM